MHKLTKNPPPRFPNGLSFGLQIGKKSQKAHSEKHFEKHCTQSAWQDVSQDPSNPQSDGFVYLKPSFSLFHPCPPKASKWSPWALLWLPNWESVFQRAHQKNMEKSLQIWMPLSSQMDLKMTCKREWVKLPFWSFLASGYHCCLRWAPGGQKTQQITKKTFPRRWKNNKQKEQSRKSYHIASHMQAIFWQCLQIQRGAAMTCRRRLQYIYIFIYIFICPGLSVNKHLSLPIHIHIIVYMYNYMYAYIYAHIYVCVVFSDIACRSIEHSWQRDNWFVWDGMLLSSGLVQEGRVASTKGVGLNS